jgi:hypothetical protein
MVCLEVCLEAAGPRPAGNLGKGIDLVKGTTTLACHAPLVAQGTGAAGRMRFALLMVGQLGCHLVMANALLACSRTCAACSFGKAAGNAVVVVGSTGLQSE